jgi:hypothetical protein
MIDARKKLFGAQREEIDVASLDRHTPADDGIEPIIWATGEADLKLGHSFKPPASLCIVVARDCHCKFRLPPIGTMQLAYVAASLAQRRLFR